MTPTIRAEIFSSPASGDANLIEARDFDEPKQLADWLGEVVMEEVKLEESAIEDEFTVTILVTEKEA